MNTATALSPPARWPQRHTVVLLSFLACGLAYTDRVNIAVASIAMREQFGWSQTEKGLVLSAFFVGYLLFMFAAGLLAARWGGKLVLGWSVVIWSAFTMLTPMAASVSMAALIVSRIGMGIGEAAMFPAAYELYGRWVPAGERARATARLLSGIPLGTLVGLTGSGWLVAHLGWPSAFYVFGAAGFAWGVVWLRTVHNNPTDDPRVGAAERLLLATAASSSAHLALRDYRRLLMSGPVAAIAAAHFASTWNIYVLMSWLPSYFREVQGLSIANAGLFSAAPWLTMFAFSNLSASVSDRMIARGADLTSTRKLMQSVSLIGSALVLLLMPYAHSASAALAMLCIAMGALGCTNAAFAPAMLDVAPRYGAVLYGFSNTFATIPGIIGVAAMGWLVDRTGTYTAGFVLTAAVSVLGALTFGLLFNARRIVD